MTALAACDIPVVLSTCVDGDVSNNLCRFRAGNSVILCRLQVIFQRAVGDSLADERSDCYQTAVAQ